MKKFKVKRKFRKNKVLSLIISILLITLFIIISFQKLDNSYQPFINYILKEQGIIEKNNSSFFNVFTKNLDILLKNYHIKEKKELAYNNKLPLVYIYNTHDTEEYNDIWNTKIVSVSNILSSSLSRYGINSIIENRKVSDYLDKNKLDYSYSYEGSRMYLEDMVLSYPTLNYFIDIHRDSVKRDVTFINYKQKNYAKLLFVLGLDNPNYTDNLMIISKINEYLNDYYPGISRGIYEKKGNGVNGVYNQDFQKNVILVEMGGIDNNLEEVINSTELLAEALYYVIGEDNEKGN